jgi:hypothetical protein
MAELDMKIVETVKKNMVGPGPVVVSFVVVGFQTAVYSLSSEPRGLTVGCWGQ